MNAALVTIGVLGTFVFVGAMIALAILYEKKRTGHMKLLADELGLAFYPKGNQIRLHEMEGFQLFSQGHGKKISNMIHGETAHVDMAIFDYRYTIGSGKNSHTYNQTVISIQSADLNLPNFALRPEHLFHRLGSMLGFQDIDFDTHPDFSKWFLLRGEDEAAVRHVFQDHVLSHLEQHRGVTVEGRRDQLIYFNARRRIKPEQIRGLMEDGFALYAMLKQ